MLLRLHLLEKETTTEKEKVSEMCYLRDGELVVGIFQLVEGVVSQT
jgi:hypothetical protein